VTGAAQTQLNLPFDCRIFYAFTMSKIHIPTPLRQYAGKQSTIDVKATTVAEAMNALVAAHPELKRHLYTDDGKLRAFVNLYVNDEDIRYLQKEATPLNDGDNISIVPSIAGGVRLASAERGL
jgi:adenylyltransferase/sulfurtransferase